MLEINKDDLLEIDMDLAGLMDLLTVIESSEYYTKEDSGVCRALRNSVETTKCKLNSIIDNAKEIPFTP